MTQFAVFNIQLPHFPKAPENYASPLYCWCKLLYEMHFNKILPEEVYSMEPKIREFTSSNAGAAQFVSRYGEVAASPAVQQAYQDWVLADFREASVMKGVRMEGVEEGIEIVARNMLQNGMSVEIVIANTGLTREQVESLR
jgi:hypothetical protein